MGVTGKVTVVMSEEPEGEEPAFESLKGRSRSMRAVLVPETGMPRIRRCCLSSDTYSRNKSHHQSHVDPLIVSPSKCQLLLATLTFRSSRLAGRGPGLTGEMLLWLEYVFLTGEEELLLAWLDGPLELQADICSLTPLQWEN